MDVKERLHALAYLRKEGIFKKNKEILAKGGTQSDLLCERVSEGPNVICSRCNGTFKQQYFSKHKKICCSPRKSSVTRSINPSSMTTSLQPLSEFEKVTQKMKKDRFKGIIESDNTIRLVGKHIFDARKADQA